MSSNSEPPSKSRRQFIKYGVAGAVGFGVASAIEIPILNNALQNDNNEIKQKKTRDKLTYNTKQQSTKPIKQLAANASFLDIKPNY